MPRTAGSGPTATSTALIGQMDNETRAACGKRQSRRHHRLHHRLPARKRCQRRPAGELRLDSAAEAYAASDGATLVQAFEAIAPEIAGNCQSPVEARQRSPSLRRGSCLCIWWHAAKCAEPPGGARALARIPAELPGAGGVAAGSAAGKAPLCRSAAGRPLCTAAPRSGALRQAGQKLSIGWGQALRAAAGAGSLARECRKTGLRSACASCVQGSAQRQSSGPACGNRRGELPWGAREGAGPGSRGPQRQHCVGSPCLPQADQPDGEDRQVSASWMNFGVSLSLHAGGAVARPDRSQHFRPRSANLTSDGAVSLNDIAIPALKVRRARPRWNCRAVAPWRWCAASPTTRASRW